MWALGVHLKYGTKTGPLTSLAGTKVNEIWKDIAAHYNPFLGNMAGPYDRAYSRDGTYNRVVIAMFWWGLWGEKVSPAPPRGEVSYQYNLAHGPAVALIMDALLEHIDEEKTAEKVRQKGSWEGSRSLKKTIWDDLTQDKKRIATSWISAPLQIGGQTVVEEVNRGNQYVPAIVHWASDPRHLPYAYNGLIMLYPSASTITAEASENSLSISHPNTTQAGTDIFTFGVAGLSRDWVWPTASRELLLSNWTSHTCARYRSTVGTTCVV